MSWTDLRYPVLLAATLLAAVASGLAAAVRDAPALILTGPVAIALLVLAATLTAGAALRGIDALRYAATWGALTALPAGLVLILARLAIGGRA